VGHDFVVVFKAEGGGVDGSVEDACLCCVVVVLWRVRRGERGGGGEGELEGGGKKRTINEYK
jgi:hypothetical protein